MSRGPGFAKGVITGHRMDYNKTKGRVVISMDMMVDGSAETVLIYITEKSANIAKKQLRSCGFDVENNSVGQLQSNPTLLAGRSVPLMYEEYNGELRPSIMTGTPPDEQQIADTDAMLRSSATRARGPKTEQPVHAGVGHGDPDNWYEG